MKPSAASFINKNSQISIQPYYPCPNFNGGLVKPPLKFGRGWVFRTMAYKPCPQLLLHAIVSVNYTSTSVRDQRSLSAPIQSWFWCVRTETLEVSSPMLNHVAWWTINTLFEIIDSKAMLNRLVQLCTVTRLKQAVELWMSQCPRNTCNVQNLQRSKTPMSVRRTIKVLHIGLTSILWNSQSGQRPSWWCPGT